MMLAYEKNQSITLTEKKNEVETLAKKLLDKEVLFQSDVEALIGKRPFEQKKLLDENGVEIPHHAHAASEIPDTPNTEA